MFDCTYQTGDFEAGDAAIFAARAPAHVREARRTLQAVLAEHPGKTAFVSSFGAESAVLLALAADVDPSVPVLFIDTRQHFPETLAYRQELAEELGLKDVRDIGLTDRDEAAHDPERELWRFDPDACCTLRKVMPLSHALAPFAAWISGRKRHQSRGRASLRVRENEGGKLKVNPLAGWSAAQIEAEFRRRDLPRHPLSLAGYPSISCATCTQAVARGEDPRSGRWAGTGKTECGIHREAGEAA